MSQEQVRHAISEALDEVAESQRIALDVSPDTKLLGGGILDSLGLLIFAAALEERLRRELGTTVSIVDLVAEEPEYWTVETMTDRVSELVGAHVRG